MCALAIHVCCEWMELCSWRGFSFPCVVLSQLIQNEYEETALFAACGRGHYDIAVVLIDHGADVNYLRKVRPSPVQHDRMVCSI